MNRHIPVPPVEPIYSRTSHTLHLILTILTFGVWALLCWWPMSMITSSVNNKKRRAYQRERAAYEQARWEWDQAHRQQQPPYQPSY